MDGALISAIAPMIVPHVVSFVVHFCGAPWHLGFLLPRANVRILSRRRAAMVGDVVDFERENARLPNIRTARCYTTCGKGKENISTVHLLLMLICNYHHWERPL